jgi:hypothetical protein
LRNAQAEEAREQDAADVSDARMGEREAEIEPHAPSDELRNQHEELNGSADQDADGKRGARTDKMAQHDAGGKNNDDDVQYDAGRCRESKVMEGVEDANADGRESQEIEIRKDDAVEGDGFVPARDFVFRGGKSVDDMGREDDASHHHYGQYQGHGPEKTIGEQPEFFGRTLAHVGGEYRDERGGEGCIAYQAPKKIGDTVGEDEGVGAEGGAKEESDALVSNVAENAAGDGDQGDNRGGF